MEFKDYLTLYPEDEDDPIECWPISPMDQIMDAATLAVLSRSSSMGRVLNSYLVQMKLGENIHDFPVYGWEYGSLLAEHYIEARTKNANTDDNS